MPETINASWVALFDDLSIVYVDGYKPEKQMVTIREADGTEWTAPSDQTGVDLPGSANWPCEQYGMMPDEFCRASAGIIWTDYDVPESSPWRFSVLLPSDSVDEFREFAKSAQYVIVAVKKVDQPTAYGDGSGVVTILKHPDGWVILR